MIILFVQKIFQKHYLILYGFAHADKGVGFIIFKGYGIARMFVSF
jgi:hypothetical protein